MTPNHDAHMRPAATPTAMRELALHVQLAAAILYMKRWWALTARICAICIVAACIRQPVRPVLGAVPI